MDVFEEIENIVKVVPKKKVRFVDEITLDDNLLFLIQNWRKIKNPIPEKVEWWKMELGVNMDDDLYG